MVRKVLLLVLVSWFVTSLGVAQQNLVVPYVYKTTTPVVIDANLKEWNFCYPIDFNRQSLPDSSRPRIDGWIPTSDTMCSGRLFMMYDDNYLYFAADVRDESPGHFSDASWAATAIEFYISNKPLGATAIKGDHAGMWDSSAAYDLQLNISFSSRLDSIVINKYNDRDNRVLRWNRNNVKYRLWDAGDGYVVEGRVPWDTLKSPTSTRNVKFVPGTRVAATWSLYHMDATELSGAFRGYAYQKTGFPAYVGPSNWQVVDVYGPPTSTWSSNGQFNFVKPYVKKAKHPVVIDANLKEWNHVFPIDFNRQSLPDSSRPRIDGWIPTSDTVCSGRLYMMYDNTYFYFAANVRDESPGHFSDASWAATACEFYFSNKALSPSALSGDHAGMWDSSAAYDLQLNISFSARLDSIVINKYNDRDNRVLRWNRNNVKYRLWDAGDGYIIEGRIPWDTLKSPTSTRNVKFVSGTRVAATWSLYHMDATELSGAFRGYAYQKTQLPAYVGPSNWQVIDVKDGTLNEDFDVLSGVELVEAPIPTEFSLSPAYPNPFNPGTNINYTLTKAGVTSLKVYDVLGRLVMTLVDNVPQDAGTYRVRVDMAGASSGVYFAILQHGQNRIAQKMMLLR